MILTIVKFILNFGGLFLINYYVGFSFIFADRYPDCDEARQIILNDIADLTPYVLFYLGLSTLLNFLYERYIEKRNKSKEFITILIFSTLIILVVSVISALSYYGHCGK